MALLAATILIGCDGNGGHQARHTVQPEGATSARFEGQIKGCQEHWDEFFCGKRGTLNSSSDVIKDANETPVIVGSESK